MCYFNIRNSVTLSTYLTFTKLSDTKCFTLSTMSMLFQQIYIDNKRYDIISFWSVYRNTRYNIFLLEIHLSESNPISVKYVVLSMGHKLNIFRPVNPTYLNARSQVFAEYKAVLRTRSFFSDPDLDPRIRFWKYGFYLVLRYVFDV